MPSVCQAQAHEYAVSLSAAKDEFSVKKKHQSAMVPCWGFVATLNKEADLNDLWQLTPSVSKLQTTVKKDIWNLGIESTKNLFQQLRAI